MVKEIKFNYKKEPKQNPYTGIVSFQHCNDEELYSDLVVKPENNMTETEHVECYPIPEYVKQKGRCEGYYPNCSVAYYRILWKELEPKQGEFNFTLIEEILEKAKRNNQTLMFRVLPHSTRESDDVPEWLKSLIDCPKRPYGQRVKDSPKDPLFLKYFGEMIYALGKRFDGDPAFAFIDVSLPGAWGEGSDVDLFTHEQIEEFVDIYTDVFKNTQIIEEIVPWIVNYQNEKRAVGWRADCIGHPTLTFERVPLKASQMADIWQKGHISMESYWWLGEWQRKEWDIDKVIEKTLELHVSTFNAKSLPIPYAWKEKVDGWNAKMGYHFVIDSVKVCDQIKCDKVEFELEIDNVGVAPVYHELPLFVKLKNSSNEYLIKTDVDTKAWGVGKTSNKISIDLPKDFTLGEYQLQLGLGGENFPVAYFACDGELDGDFVNITQITVQ